jgi:hypothetical protein
LPETETAGRIATYLERRVEDSRVDPAKVLAQARKRGLVISGATTSSQIESLGHASLA